ncbi:FecR family protein [uncultured Polaribacter sp.]|uniref:FecR family protein n=1 Tax=uncultured Polaribacter sp. TaxID=174711 RepID=UPI00261AF04B|nr:FecR family protein [uncultured Polaribacter sp.]
MYRDRIEEIIVKFITKSISADELDILSEWIEHKENEQFFYEYIKLNYVADFNLSSFNKEKAKLLFLSSIEEKTIVNKKRKLLIPLKYIAAVAIIFIVSLPFIFKKSDFSKKPVVYQEPVLPGEDKAILTLQDGENVFLEKGKNYKKNNVKSNGENLFYNQNKSQENSKIAYNYLTIPRGGQFFVQLSDGTKVWLNSESKLKYPVKFIEGQSRKVELIYGEAYFKVSSSKNHNGSDFRVNSNAQDIVVLGTEFNIKANQNSNFIKTTLVEGSVEVNNGVVRKLLSPGEQSIININNEKIDLKKVDVSYEIAWKNGFFMFDKESLEDIMKTLARWYDVNVVYENVEKRNVIFSGFLNRKDNINELLDYLEKTGEIDFEISDKEIKIK